MDRVQFLSMEEEIRMCSACRVGVRIRLTGSMQMSELSSRVFRSRIQSLCGSVALPISDKTERTESSKKENLFTCQALKKFGELLSSLMSSNWMKPGVPAIVALEDPRACLGVGVYQRTIFGLWIMAI